MHTGTSTHTEPLRTGGPQTHFQEVNTFPDMPTIPLNDHESSMVLQKVSPRQGFGELVCLGGDSRKEGEKGRKPGTWWGDRARSEGSQLGETGKRTSARTLWGQGMDHGLHPHGLSNTPGEPCIHDYSSGHISVLPFAIPASCTSGASLCSSWFQACLPMSFRDLLQARLHQRQVLGQVLPLTWCGSCPLPPGMWQGSALRGDPASWLLQRRAWHKNQAPALIDVASNLRFKRM